MAISIVAASAALVFIGLLVQPGLSGQLRRTALADLTALAVQQEPQFQRALANEVPADELARLAERTADATTTRVSVLGVARSTAGLQTFSKADSAGGAAAGELQFPAATAAASSRQRETAVEAGPEGRVGQVALPLITPRTAPPDVDAVLVLSRPLNSEEPVLAWATRRFVVAILVALVAAVLSGLFLARRLTRRIGELEAVAERVAAGDLTTPFPTSTSDEFGSLGVALEEMRSQLAELDSARKRFIATASHELRTPLFSLGGFLELLEDEDVSEADRVRFIAHLREQVTRMQTLATDLLDLSRIDAGALELHETSVDLRAVARTVATEFAPVIADHDAHLELRLPESPLYATCDPERVTQVLRILIANALAHTPRGTDVVLAVSRRGTRARLSVVDFGPGISRSVLPTIFEPFATTDDMQGTGLGLAIARELATRMRGTLRVESRPGLTRFTLDLAPSASEEEQPAAPGVG